MKISASSSLPSLDKFIGKEVWVRARVKLKYGYSYGLIRIISKQTETQHSERYPEHTYDVTTYTFNLIEMKRLNRGNALVCTEEEKDYTLSHPITLSEYSIRLIYPIECVTTEEIFEITD